MLTWKRVLVQDWQLPFLERSPTFEYHAHCFYIQNLFFPYYYIHRISCTSAKFSLHVAIDFNMDARVYSIFCDGLSIFVTRNKCSFFPWCLIRASLHLFLVPLFFSFAPTCQKTTTTQQVIILIFSLVTRTKKKISKTTKKEDTILFR